MAIEQSMIASSFECDSQLRNAPTPPLKNVKEEDFELDFSLFQTNNLEFDIYQNLTLSPENNSPITLQPSIPIQPTMSDLFNDPFTDTFSCMNQQYIPGPSTSEDNFSFMDDSFSEQKAINDKKARKEKCMSRNAIAARENREKKKNELTTLRQKVDELQAEATSYKKKYTDIKESFKHAHEKNQYYESILGNLPSIMGIIEHMQSMPKTEYQNETTKKLKKKLNNVPITSKNLGICFHVKNSQEMSLKFCEHCSKMKEET